MMNMHWVSATHATELLQSRHSSTEYSVAVVLSWLFDTTTQIHNLSVA